MVEQLVTRRGSSYEAIIEIRARWGLEHVPAQLPPESEDILLPPSMGEPGSSKEQRGSWPKEKARWMEDLHYVLRRSVPEKYVNSKFTLYPAGPRDPERWLPWYRFAAGCVLYDPPLSEDLPAFAEYGGLLRLAGENINEEPVLGVLDSCRLRMEEIGLEMEMREKEAAYRLMWEHREEFAGLDFHDAWHEVYQRYSVELCKQRVQAQEEYNLEIERHEPTYYVAVEDDVSQTELRKKMQDVAAHRKEGRLPVGRPSRDRLQAITVAILMDQCGWTQKQVADHYGWKDETTVSKWAKDGRDLLGGR